MLKSENARLQESVVNLCQTSEENTELHKVITKLQQSIKMKEVELEACSLQVRFA